MWLRLFWNEMQEGVFTSGIDLDWDFWSCDVE